MAIEVPEFRTEEYGPKRSDVCVAVFVIDEGEKLLRQLGVMQEVCGEYDVIVADGGSTDGSVERSKLESRGVRTLLVKTGEGRLSAQMRMAFHYALVEGYAGIVTIDGNGKDDPSAIHAFARSLDEGYDHLQGSRFVPGGIAVNTPFLRLIGIRLLHAPLISLAAGFRYTDTTNGFRAYSRRLLEDTRVAPFRAVFSGYEMHYYLAIRAARLGFRCKELPVTRSYPSGGPTPTKIRGWKGNLLVLRTLFRACLGVFNPPEGAREQP